MKRTGVTLCVGLAAVLLYSTAAQAQPELVARGVTEARRSGDEMALIHLADEIGPMGVAECLEHASRSGRLVCAEAARYNEQWWSTLTVLATVLDDHDRQIASRAAESMAVLLLTVQTGDLGYQEPILDEAEALLTRLRDIAMDRRISLDVRAQVVAISGSFARIVGAGLEVPRETIGDPEMAVRRAAVGALMGSEERDDIEALLTLSSTERDPSIAALAIAGLCEVTLGAGAPLPDSIEDKVRTILEDEDSRPSQIRPLLACLARSGHQQATELQELAARHPNEASRAVWVELTREEEP